MQRRNFWALWAIWLGTSTYWAVENFWINLYWARNVDPRAIYISLMVAITAVVGVLTQIVFGGISDASGRKRGGRGRTHFILVGGVLGGVTMCLFPVTRLLSPTWVVVVYACVVDSLITFLGDQTTPTRIALLADVTTPDERGRVNAKLAIPSGIGSIVVIALSGYVMEFLGDDFVFYLGGTCLAATALACYKLADEPASEPTETNWWQNVKRTFELGSIRENPDVYYLLGYVFVNSFGVQVFFPYLFIYLENSLLLEGVELSVALGGILGFSVVGLPAGWFADRYGRKKTLIFVVPANGIAIALLTFVKPGIGLGIILLAGASQAFGVAAGITVNSWLADLVPEERRGALLTYLVVAAVIPMTPGSLLGAYIADTYGSAPGVYSPLMFLVGGLIALSSVVFVSLAGEPRLSDTGASSGEGAPRVGPGEVR
ncbi:MAG: MFS transporter [Promethearchaeota archaeon]